jgi:tetratricopeptide (TPR) repeat protein
MPTTVNGVGTHYYGKRDVSSRTGTCRNCGAHTKLESYETRLWFVILFIPIIPLKRVRLLDYCSSCHRHWVANPEQYEMSRQLAVSGAMEKYREQPSVDAALVVHAQLLSFHMHEEADTFRTAVLEQYADNADLREGLAAHLDQMGRWTEATPLYEQAFRLNPDLPEVRCSLAWRRANENKLDEAYDLLDFLRQPGAGQSFNLGSLETLAKSYQKEGNHERALEIFAHLLQEVPASADQVAFRKLVQKSERALHRSPSLLPTKSFSIRGLFDSKSGTHAPWVRWAAFGAVVLVLFAAGMAGMNEYRRTHRTLHVVNAFAQTVTVSVDGGPPIIVSQRTPVPISEGKHRLSITGPVTKQTDIDLETGYWSRWTYNPVWVFNVEKVASVSAATIHYALNPQPAENRWLNDTELSFVPHVDYVFEQPPQSMKVERKTQVITKIHVGLMPVLPSTTFLGLRNPADQTVAMTFAEGYLERNQNDVSLLYLYSTRTEGEESERRVTAFLEKGLWQSKPPSIPWHRAYQNQKTVAANDAPLLAEYDRRLAVVPEDATLLYLRGSVGPNRADQLKYYRLANEKDPQLGWPDYALGFDAALRGDWREAREWCEKAAPKLRSDISFRGMWHIVRLANGEAEGMESEYRQQLHSRDFAEVMTGLFGLIDALASQQKYDQTRQVIRDWMTAMGGLNSSPAALSAFDPLVDYACGDIDAMRRKKDQTVPKGQSDFQFQCLLAIGEPDAAVKLEGNDKLNTEWNAMLAASLSYSLTGKPEEADAWRTRACGKLKEGDRGEKRAAALLQADHAPSKGELNEMTLRISDAALVTAALAQRFPDQKRALNARAGRLNISRLHPYLLVKQAVEQP